MRIPVLTYHSMNVHGNDYANNDHVALADDLRTLHALGIRIISAGALVSRLLNPQGAQAEPGVRLAVISFDDGSDFDFRDLPHPTWGTQRSMLNVLRDFHEQTGAAAHATSFVIVSPQAREVLDRTCMIGAAWWNEDWWQEAIGSGHLDIGNHSWDHNHPTLESVAPHERGTFRVIDNFVRAEAQIAQSAAYLQRVASNPGAALFAYPYGECNDFLIAEYFPACGERVGVRAAFTCEPRPVTRESDRWSLPRYVFGAHWKSPGELAALLRDAAGG